jgi:outer membrane protein assembly factor BamB
MVYVQDSNGVIYALNKNNGTLRWNVTFGIGSPAFDDGSIFAKSSAGFVARLDASTGALAWNHSFAYSIYSNPAVADGMVFVATWNEGKVYALSASNGSQIWQSSYLTWSLESTPVVVGGLVYVGGGDRMIYVLDEYDGSLVKTYGPVGGYLNQGPVVAYGKLFVGVGDYNRTVYAISEDSGEILWSYPIGGTAGPMIEPRVADHKVFVGSMSSPPLLFVLNESNGELIWSFKPNVTGLITDIGVANGKVFSSMGDRFYVLGDAVDVAILSVTPYKIYAHQGFNVSVGVTVQNEGSETESFRLAANYSLGSYTLPTGLVGYWNADEGLGTVAHDGSGCGNNGTLYNGTAWADGKCGKALSFDGIDDCVNVLDSPCLDITKNITVEAWICPKSYGKIPDEFGQYHAGIVSKAGAYSLIFLYSNETHTHVQFMINSTGIRAVKTKAISPALDQWHHIAGVYDSNYLRVYLDGTEIANVPAENYTLVTNNQSLRIGWDNYLGTNARRFDGLIDEIRVYDRALERSEILADMPYCGEIASQNVTLARAEIATINFTWNTNFTWNGKPFAMGNYTITACADSILGETDTYDNKLDFEVVKLSIPGDVNGDYKVGPADFAFLSVAYGSTPSEPKWNPNCDINSDGKVGPADFAYLSAHYGEHFP